MKKNLYKIFFAGDNEPERIWAWSEYEVKILACADRVRSGLSSKVIQTEKVTT